MKFVSSFTTLNNGLSTATTQMANMKNAMTEYGYIFETFLHLQSSVKRLSTFEYFPYRWKLSIENKDFTGMYREFSMKDFQIDYLHELINETVGKNKWLFWKKYEQLSDTSCFLFRNVADAMAVNMQIDLAELRKDQ